MLPQASLLPVVLLLKNVGCIFAQQLYGFLITTPASTKSLLAIYLGFASSYLSAFHLLSAPKLMLSVLSLSWHPAASS